jgi:hypothetical protein
MKTANGAVNRYPLGYPFERLVILRDERRAFKRKIDCAVTPEFFRAKRVGGNINTYLRTAIEQAT